jgi:glycosyltransferase involved in cell wall biosynthesis
VKISLIQPGRNNLKYLKWSYDSIRKNQGTHEVQICVADDASTDGTWDWCIEMMKKDPDFKAIKNDTGKRLGHTILYDRLVDEVADHDICMIYHADMYLCPGALDAIEWYLKPNTIVSLTRIEPPLHPPGPEKLLQDFGVEPEEFKEDALLEWIGNTGFKDTFTNKTTEGIFAPWAFWKEDFQDIGGHDPLYAPQSKEDSDIFNRFQMNGIKFVQTWEGCVYHMTCRGSRRNTIDKAKNIYEDSPEWLEQNMRSTRNFIRKWGHFVKHDQYMKPIVPSKYDIGLIIKNCNLNLLRELEPWCSTVYCDEQFKIGRYQDYIEMEQINTQYDLQERILPIDNKKQNGVIIEVDGNRFSQEDFEYITKLSEILDADEQLREELIHFSDDPEFELGNMKITVNSLNTIEQELIICKKQ